MVLHGCGQDGAGYDEGAGWSTLADRYGFVPLLPEQQRANNPQNCFNWFEPGDTDRDRGEALSIRQMVERMVRDHGVDLRRVFVTGLSAGGAMTSVMLAAFPDVFAGGAIIAGLPYRSATSVAEALEGMFQGRTRSAQEWGDLVRQASPHRGPWRQVSVWHGSADATVKPMNAGEIIKQWTNVHGLPLAPSGEDVVDGYPRRLWSDREGNPVVEEFTITGMAHGTPLAVGDGDEDFGAAGPFLLDVGISSSYHIAKFWGLTGSGAQARPEKAEAAQGRAALPPETRELMGPPGRNRMTSRVSPMPARPRAWSGRNTGSRTSNPPSRRRCGPPASSNSSRIRSCLGGRGAVICVNTPSRVTAPSERSRP